MALLAMLLLVSAPALRGSAAVASGDATLSARSDVIVHGVVRGSYVRADRDGLPETVTSIEPIRVLKGDVVGTLQLVRMGGTLPAGESLKAYGQPAFASGAEVVVMCRSRRDGTQALTGPGAKLDVLIDRNGERFAAPDATSACPADGVAVDGRYRRLSTFLEYLACGQGTTFADFVDKPSELVPVRPGFEGAGARQALWSDEAVDGCWRWTDMYPMSANRTKRFLLVSSNPPAIEGQTDGGLRLTAAAIDAWNNDPRSDVSYRLITDPNDLQPGDDPSTPSVLVLGFNGLVGSEEGGATDWRPVEAGGVGCVSGEASLGSRGVGIVMDNGDQHTYPWRGELYRPVRRAAVYVRCTTGDFAYSAQAFQSLVLHQLGHTLGLGHSTDPLQSSHDWCLPDNSRSVMGSTTMPIVLGDDDKAAMEWMYGHAAGTPEPRIIYRSGDLDLDGDVDVFDVLVQASAIVGNMTLAPPFHAPESAADYDGNGVVDVFDLLDQLGYIVGNVSCLPVPEPVTGGRAALASVSGPARASTELSVDGNGWDLSVGLDLRASQMNGQPASLGGYQFSVRFDSDALRLESVSGGTDAFASMPQSTSVASANATGLVQVLGANLQGGAGRQTLAHLRFVALGPGDVDGRSIRVFGWKAGSTFVDCGAGVVCSSPIQVSRSR